MRQWFVYLVLVLALAIAVATTANATAVEDAMAAYNRGDSDGALRILRVAAEANDPKAQFSLGTTLFYGLWPPINKDVAEGAKWLRAAANNNIVAAQLALAQGHYHGYGVAKDLDECFRWFRRAADNGDAYAQYRVGRAFWE